MQKKRLLHHFQHILDHDHHQASSNSHGSLAGNQGKVLWILDVILNVKSRTKHTTPDDCSRPLKQAPEVFVLHDVLQPLQCFCHTIFQGFDVGPLKSLRYLCWSLLLHEFPHGKSQATRPKHGHLVQVYLDLQSVATLEDKVPARWRSGYHNSDNIHDMFMYENKYVRISFSVITCMILCIIVWMMEEI